MTFSGLSKFMRRLVRLNSQVERQAGRNLLLAVAVGLVVGGGFLFSLLFLPVLFMILAVAVASLATVEVAQVLRKQKRYYVFPVVPLAALLPTMAYFYGLSSLLISAAVAVPLLLAAQLARQLVNRKTISAGFFRELLAALLLLLVLPGPVALLLLVYRETPGPLLLLIAMIVVVATDTFAYSSGILWGRRPLAPRVSPKKTWEGFAGGLLGAVTLGIIFSIAFYVMFPRILGPVAPLWLTLLVLPLFSFTATAGDLLESQFKRWVGVKDMSSWVPGHGGVLDRLDSIVLNGYTLYSLFLLSQLLK